MLEVRELYKKYGKKQILRGVSFQAGTGECIGIVGGNGCGKTTLLSILAGVNRPDRGSICFEGTEAVGKRALFERYAAYVPQESPLIPELSARDNYRLWFRGDKLRMEEDLKNGVGKKLGLTEFLSTPAGKLSGGQKKRLSIASALADRAKVLILDEPGAALDLAAKEEILRYIREYTAQGGTVLLTSHEMAELSVCTRLFLLKNGVLEPVAAGSSAEELIARF
ncbi:MAG: heme ABC exporter ATP-binding protein CcmA [Otoolea sp.]|nr:heme ABC exporter ATP-binding protein CcmA [Clostridiaceae bacterium]MDD6074496.1 heme ABC exporter ATP-binding protein CcmA [Clostridium sp.]MDY5483234.1 heme ABC exporter ATP-binding protein CcmA [Clostridium sp.]